MIVDSTEFQKNVSKLSGIIKNNNLLILNNVLLTCRRDSLYMIGTNDETLMEVKQSYKGEPIEALVDYKTLQSLIKPHKGETKLEINGKNLLLESGKTKGSLSLVNDKYPNVVIKKYPKFIDVDPVIFEEMVSTFNKFLEPKEREFTKIVNVGKESVFLDNSSRICVFKKPMMDSLLPLNTITVLNKLKGAEVVRFATDNTANWFIIDNVFIKSSKFHMEGEYPQWERIIPDTNWTISFNRKELLDGLKPLGSIVDKGKPPLCKLMLKDKQLTFLANTTSVQSEFTVELTEEYKPFYMEVLTKDLIKILGHYGVENIIFNIGQLNQDIYVIKFLDDTFDYYLFSYKEMR